MSVEIPRYNNRHDQIVIGAQHLATEALKASGVNAGTAHTIGERSAEYAIKGLIAAIEEVHGEETVVTILNPAVRAAMQADEHEFRNAQSARELIGD